jgi:hypothetical protein
MGNTSNVAAGHLGDPTFAGVFNINRFTLYKLLSGQVTHIRDIFAATTCTAALVCTQPPDVPTHVYIREPLSGTYNTMEWNIPNSREVNGDPSFSLGVVRGQDENAAPPANNPLNQTSANLSTRIRAIGTGEMVTAVNGNADAVGYAFWSFGAFSGKANLKFFTVDGVDPLQPGPTPAPPVCAALPCKVPMTHIVDGGYPIWSVLRVYYDPTDLTTLVPTMVNYANSVSDPTTGNLTDYIPFTAMRVFRSHYSQVVTTAGGGYTGNNGFKTGIPQTGGDAGGAVLTIASELDFITDTGNQQIDLKQ